MGLCYLFNFKVTSCPYLSLMTFIRDYNFFFFKFKSKRHWIHLNVTLTILRIILIVLYNQVLNDRVSIKIYIYHIIIISTFQQ